MTLPRSDVLVIGPGRVGTVLAAALARAGHRVVGVAGGSQGSRDRFQTAFAGVRAAADPAQLAPRADLVVVTTPDDAIESVVTALAAADALHPGQRVVHTCGVHGLAPLRRAALAGCEIAACHPAQTVPTATADPEVLVGATWAVTAPATSLGWARDLVEQVGGTPVEVPDDRRALYHAGLVVASNAVGAAVATARQLLLAAKIPDPALFLAPLVDASVDNVMGRGAAALTGPVVRGDVGTVGAHLTELDHDAPALAASYRLLSRAILQQVRADLPEDVVAALDDLLADPGRG